MYPKELLQQPALALSSVQTSTQRLGEQALNSQCPGSFLEASICPQQHQRAPSSCSYQHSKHTANRVRNGKGTELQKQSHMCFRTSLHLHPGVALLQESEFQLWKIYFGFSGSHSTEPSPWTRGICRFWKAGERHRPGTRHREGRQVKAKCVCSKELFKYWHFGVYCRNTRVTTFAVLGKTKFFQAPPLQT